MKTRYLACILGAALLAPLFSRLSSPIASLPTGSVPPAVAECDCRSDTTLDVYQAEICANYFNGLYEPPSGDIGDLKAVGIKITILRKPTPGVPGGTPCLPEPTQADFDTLFAQLNSAFSRANIQFYQVAPIQYVGDSKHQARCEQHLIDITNQYNVPGLINVYYCDTVSAGGNCTISIPPCQSINLGSNSAHDAPTTWDGMFLSKCRGSDCIPSECFTSSTCTACLEEACHPKLSGVFIHELGHYFDLLHLHETAYGVECTGTDMNNCATCGDFVCDTDAQPLPATYSVNPGTCTTTPLPPPSCGLGSYVPVDLLNFMTVPSPQCNSTMHFTRGQLRRARATLLNLRPDLIN